MSEFELNIFRGEEYSNDFVFFDGCEEEDLQEWDMVGYTTLTSAVLFWFDDTVYSTSVKNYNKHAADMGKSIFRGKLTEGTLENRDDVGFDDEEEVAQIKKPYLRKKKEVNSRKRKKFPILGKKNEKRKLVPVELPEDRKARQKKENDKQKAVNKAGQGVSARFR